MKAYIVAVLACVGATFVSTNAQMPPVDMAKLDYNTIGTVEFSKNSTKQIGPLRGLTEEGESYRVTSKSGRLSGAMVYVSGKGAWGKLSGQMVVSSRVLDYNREYTMLREKRKISAGVKGFWNYIVSLSADATAEREEVVETLHELTQEMRTEGTFNIDLWVTGLYMNVPVYAGAYVAVLEIEDSSGNKFNFLSDGAPTQDIYPEDDSGNELPQKDNDSSIVF